MKPARGHLADAELDDAVDGALSLTRAAHLAGCAACRSRVAAAQAIRVALERVADAEAATETEAPPDVAQRVLRTLRGRRVASGYFNEVLAAGKTLARAFESLVPPRVRGSAINEAPERKKT